MVMPLYDDNTGRTITPVVNYLLIAANVLVFVFLQGGGTNERFTYAYSAVPEEIRTGKDIYGPVPIDSPTTGEQHELPLERTPIPVYLTLLTSIFMHGSWAHLLGNMLFLWIFGDNIEDSLGHGRYLIYYLLCGLLASLAHVWSVFAFDGNPMIPSLGASGAISGVLGGYILLHPNRRVMVILLRIVTWVPAYVAVGMWFALQLISGLADLGSKMGGVAYGAHIGGFIAGLVLIKPFTIGRTPDEVERPVGRWVRR
ncbi:MAG: rhomboid family intramembrane serine protease [Gemmataceae bacterium]